MIWFNWQIGAPVGLVTEFFDGAVELGAAEVDDGLGIIRKLWHAGLAHRDVKPGNLLVRDGHMLLIDVAFAEARPSPWRQAVDLDGSSMQFGFAPAVVGSGRSMLSIDPQPHGPSR